MTRAFAALRDERRDFELRPWLFRVAHNEAVSLLRRRREAEPLDEQAAGDGPLDEQVALAAELDALRGDLGALPERQRAALVLRELSGLSHGEIAKALGATPQLVKQTIFQARTALMQAREGREMQCADVRRALSDGDGRVLRGTRIRAHLRSCASCRRFEEDLERRPRELALLAPPLSPAAGAALLDQLLPGAAAGASAMAGTAAVLGPKTAIMLAAVATAAGGGAVVRHAHPAARAPEPAMLAAAAAPRTASPTPAWTPAPFSGPRWAVGEVPALPGKPPSTVEIRGKAAPTGAALAHGKPPWAAIGRPADRGRPPRAGHPGRRVGQRRPARAGATSRGGARTVPAVRATAAMGRPARVQRAVPVDRAPVAAAANGSATGHRATPAVRTSRRGGQRGGVGTPPSRSASVPRAVGHAPATQRPARQDDRPLTSPGRARP
jgi:RNA polymerase sigma factor (sigma-70 family)